MGCCPNVIYEFKGEFDFLSNFYTYRFVYEGDVYPSAEHAFQAQKTDDEEEKEDIRIAKSSVVAKKLGRKCTLRKCWDEDRQDIMLDVVRVKFETDLKWELLETGVSLLIEGNSWGDSYWGVDLITNQGENHLGKSLMRVRSWIRETLGSENI